MKNDDQQLATQTSPIADMLQKVIEKGVTADNVAALDKLCDLYERVEAKRAERLFNEAFTKLQSTMPQVEATKPVPNRDGTVRYRFAPFEEIMEKVQPFLTSNGFSINFDTRFDNGRMIVVCNLRHVSGHSQKNEFAVRIGQGPPGATETQADGAAKTYAKRGALSDALNIVVDRDDDARGAGKPIGRALAEDLRDRVKKCGANEEAFLRFAGVQAFSVPPKLEDYELIAMDRHDYLDQLLSRKEKGGKKDEDAPW